MGVTRSNRCWRVDDRPGNDWGAVGMLAWRCASRRSVGVMSEVVGLSAGPMAGRRATKREREKKKDVKDKRLID